jgi:hypothetical protein
MLTTLLLVLLVLVILFVIERHKEIKQYITDEIHLVHSFAAQDVRRLGTWINAAESRVSSAVAKVDVRVKALEPAAVADATGAVAEVKTEVAKVEGAL